MRPANVIANEQLNPYEEARKQLKASADRLEELYPNWVPSNDARISWFHGAIKTLAVTQLELLLIREYLSKKDWWESMRKSQVISGDLGTVPNLLEEYDIHIRLWTFHSVFLQLEESLRQVIKYLDPEAYSKRHGSFAKLYSYLLTETGLNKFDQLFKLIAYTRNTIHNNGVFWPTDEKGKDVDIDWDGQGFEFRVGKRIRWLTHDNLRKFIVWLNQAMLEIMVSEPVGKMSKVGRFEGE